MKRKKLNTRLRKPNKVKQVYLASPFSHEDEAIMALRATLIDIVMAKLYKKYKIAIYPPILISIKIKEILGDEIGTTFREWSKVDLAAVEHSDELWVVCMEGYKDSIGVQAEIKHAKKHKIPVKYINPATLKLNDEEYL